MAIVIDSNLHAGFSAGASATQAFNNVAGDYLTVIILAYEDNASVSGVTYNGVAMTKLVEGGAPSNQGEHALIYGLKGPATGSNNVVASFSPSNPYGGDFIIASFTGVDQTTPTGNTAATGATEATSQATPMTLSISMSANSMAVDGVLGNGTPALTKDASQTSIYEGLDSGGGERVASSYKTSATSMIYTWTGGARRLAMAIAELKVGGAPSLAVAITSPTSSPTYNNGTTSTITIGGTTTAATSVTWSNDRGGSGSATNTGTSYSTWSISGITLSLGANVITVTAGDGSTTVTDTITVSRFATSENCRGFTSLGVASTDKITSALTTNATQRTYAVWFNNVDSNLLFAKYTAALTEQINFGAGPIYYQRVWTGGTAAWSVPSPGSGWHHLAITYDSSSTSNAPLIYVDGVSQTVTLQTAASGTLVNNSDPYTLGNNGAGTGNWDGMLSEFAIWNRILSAAEILDMATAAGGYQGKSPLYYPTSLVEYIPLNDSPVTSKVLTNPTVTGTAVQTGLAIDYPSVAGQLTATFTDSLAGGELL